MITVIILIKTSINITIPLSSVIKLNKARMISILQSQYSMNMLIKSLHPRHKVQVKGTQSQSLLK
jgi:hypothetical protein